MLSWLVAHWRLVSGSLLALITILSLVPLPELPPAGGSDKLHHFVAYASVTIPIALSQNRNWWRLTLLVVVWSGLIELLQPYVNRQGEWLDLLANAGGVLLGVALGFILNRLSVANSND